MADRPFGGDVDRIRTDIGDAAEDFAPARQREPDAGIARQADARKPFRVEENDLGAECLRRLRIRLQRVDDSIDLGPPCIGGDEDPHQAALARWVTGASSSAGEVHRISSSPFDVLDHDGAAFDPVAAIDVVHAADVAAGGMVDVAADDAVAAVAARLRRERLLEIADVVDGLLELELGPARQRPVAEAETATKPVGHLVDRDGEHVGLVAEQRQPARVLHHEIEAVAMGNEIAPAVGSDMHGIGHHLDAAEMRAEIVAQELVVVAGNVDEPRSLAGLAQQLLDHVVVGLRPVPAGFQLPAVDDVADEIDRVGLEIAQEGEKPFRLARLGPQMHV